MRRLILGLVLGLSIVANAQISDTGSLRTYINAHIVPNGNRSITAKNLNDVLNGYLNNWPDTGSLSARMFLKPDSITRKFGTDSVFAYYHGSPVFSWKDTVTLNTILASLGYTPLRPNDTANLRRRIDSTNLALSGVWKTAGNTGIDTAINFIGTRDRGGILFKIHNE